MKFYSLAHAFYFPHILGKNVFSELFALFQKQATRDY